MGLALGILMVTGLLLLILIQGLVVFWPREVVQVTLRTSEGKTETTAGEIRKVQHRKDVGKGGKEVEEWLLFTGNKDVTGNGFRYLDVQNISEQTKPADLIIAERMEYGDAIFRAVSLKLSDGTVVPNDDARLLAELDRLVGEANKRRKEITKIEKGKIGKINTQLAKLDLEEKELKAESSRTEERLGHIAQKRTALQSEYQKLAAEAQALRKQQQENVLTYRTPEGTEKNQNVGDIVSYYRPNALGFGGKIGWFIHGIWDFIWSEPREANTEGGIFPAIFGTFVMTILMSALVTPLGVVAAIYLREYAKQGMLVQCVRISVNNLAGVPSIVFGVFGLGFFVYFLGASIDQLFFSSSLPTPTFGTGGILWASFTLALLTLPVVIVATEEALVAVPRGVREAGLACGASKWQMIQRVVLPSALPGILTGVILSMARGAGEVAPLMLVGVVKLAPSLPLDLTAPFIHAERKFMHLGFHIYDLGFQSPDSEAAKPMVFATTLLLITLVVVMNVAAIRIRTKLRKKYAASTF
ncbi:phosphate ABC transporter permease PstA [Roseimicrobium gellanilyticum]|uniref:phosphate ABC transporter permease PstA n=1 Tax=Roseimicrobium gellanilyticum TaxID=748857 RepID=UPI001FE2FFED|nr:phosphate ABC transporter permease PstA [Roseimicrobium gellanilyticum]